MDKYVLISILMKQAVVSSETSVQFCQAKFPHILKYSNCYSIGIRKRHHMINICVVLRKRLTLIRDLHAMLNS